MNERTLLYSQSSDGDDRQNRKSKGHREDGSDQKRIERSAGPPALTKYFILEFTVLFVVDLQSRITREKTTLNPPATNTDFISFT